ncbi:hypothetical protein Tco_1535574, partial [Tanacetum coccineum]
ERYESIEVNKKWLERPLGWYWKFSFDLFHNCLHEFLDVISYACSDSLLMMCNDDIHEVTPCVSALAGCDRLVSDPLVIENYVPLSVRSFVGEPFSQLDLSAIEIQKRSQLRRSSYGTKGDRVVDRLSNARSRHGPTKSGDSCEGKVKPK